MLYRYEKKAISFKTKIVVGIEKKKRTLSMSLAIFCFSSGILILVYSLFPYIQNSFENVKGSKIASKSILNPSQLGGSNSLAGTSNEFSSTYVSNVTNNFALTNKLLNITARTHPEYASITGEMKVSIPRINVRNVGIKINVDSFDENVYMKQLEKTLGHFLGTSLPDKPGNTFVYGHSTNELLAKTNPNNPEFAFSFLKELDIGDDIFVTYNKKEYHYTTQQIKFVSPSDISPIYTTSEAKMLTLMTCHPPGIGTDRLILTAKQVIK